MRSLLTHLFFVVVLAFCMSCHQADKSVPFDLVVYGSTSSGIAAAIQADRMNKSVILISPDSRIGGLTTGGLGQTDIGNKQAIGGISREFYQNIRTYYHKPENWKWQEKSDYKDGGQTRTAENEDAMWTFEPSAALKVYQQMLEEHNIDIRYDQRLDRQTGVKKENGNIISIKMESGEEYLGKMFIDATYEGDLMAAAGVSYTVGRESNDTYGENLNGVQPNDTSRTLTGILSINGEHHNFVDGVDPYVVKGDSASGVLPFIDTSGPGTPGEGDRRVQAYCFRLCLTDHPENRIPFSKPDNYNELNYELLFRNYEAGFNDIPWINSSMPNRKTDTNNKDGFSMDFVGQNYSYPEASYEEREKIKVAHRKYQQGLMWSLAYHPRIPADIRDEVSRWGTCKDEFQREDGWQLQLYIREARRMISELVITQKHCERLKVVDDPVGLAAYGMDSHNTQRYITKEGYVKNEGNVEAPVASPFPISYRSIIPKRSECKNLVVPVCLSASHIAFGSIRMEPVFMVLGQSAATAAIVAINSNVPLQDVDYEVLKEQLIKDKQRLQ
ncbi:Putative xanthan lyase [Fulvivirga imtechensis AK7]|uniref:Putative xanthan lyase n=1 Tax=Fulvivirga imtechensis AK7 TaxID=1237149 RepID=L8K1I4_9BACT|nr:FAD-dependent oxidoreductase [Fulvivirga imtechensis]ELR73779.1 Putative xanthan lyase [Fulvivirga imtechensis AK7]